MSESNGRDKGGRFAAGNPGGPGRPRRDVERQYLEATIAAVPIDAWTKIVEKARDDAIAGDAKAREWLGKALGTDAPQKIAYTDTDGDSVTFATVLALAQSAPAPPRPDSEPRPNVVDVDAEIERLDRGNPDQ